MVPPTSCLQIGVCANLIAAASLPRLFPGISRLSGRQTAGNSEQHFDTVAFVMIANTASEETELLEGIISRLSAELAPVITVERSNRVVPGGPGGPTGRVDDLIDIGTKSGYVATLAVEAKRNISPRDAERMLPGQVERLARLANIQFLVVAPWLSSRTRELLAGRGFNYADLTGNTLIRIEQPPVYIRTDGASRDPSPAARGSARLRGPKAGRLIRYLADVLPPYGVRELSAKADLAPGYVSRLLEALDREALIERDDRGRVRSVDVPRTLRRYAESYDIFKANSAALFVGKAGAAQVLGELGGLGRSVAITGSFAASRLAPVAAPALLVVYCDDVAATATGLNLLPASEGANVVLLRPFDPIVWERTEADGLATYVAPTQVALDCLAGNGRMPAEGEAVLTWLSENESNWRAPSLDEITPMIPSD
jgi:hypothetical protein